MKRLFFSGVIGFLVFLILSSGLGLKNTFLSNLNRVRIFKAWEAVSVKENYDDNAVHDGIPDNWSPCSWGNATGFYEIEDQEVFNGNQAIRVSHTNKIGVICLSQTIVIPQNVNLLVKVYAKGDGGVIQTRLHDHITGDWKDYGFKGWREIKPSSDWKQYQFSFEVPTNVDQVELRLRGANYYDDVYLGMVNDNGEVGNNLLNNPGFESDGFQQNALQWWTDNNLSINYAESLSDVPFSSLSYINILDTLMGRYDSIQERAEIIGNDCALAPEMAGFLISKGMNNNLPGGLSASERIFQFAIDLMPNCPQPYAALAKLYSSQRSYLLAANLFHQASALSGTTPLAGKYSFEEGFIHVRHTGLIDQAIPALKKAEHLDGWERSSWHYGAATFFLGTAYESKGMLEDAFLAYQRVMDCSECTEHHEIAKSRLDKLSNIQSQQ